MAAGRRGVLPSCTLQLLQAAGKMESHSFRRIQGLALHPHDEVSSHSERKEQKKFTLFSNHYGSLRQPEAPTQKQSDEKQQPMG